jgi:hypothetical protein
MLADTSISREDVSKGNPPRPGRPSGTRTPAGGRRGGRQAEASASEAARHTGCRRPPPRRRAGARSPPRRGGVTVEERRTGGGGVSGRAAASQRAAASGTEMRVGDGEGRRRWDRARRRRETALCACQGGATRRKGVEWRIRKERLVGDGCGENGRVEEERHDLGENG